MKNIIKIAIIIFITAGNAYAGYADLLTCKYEILGEKIINNKSLEKSLIFTNDINKFKKLIDEYGLIIKQEFPEKGMYILYGTNNIISNVSYQRSIQTLFIDLIYDTRKVGYDKRNTTVLHAIVCESSYEIKGIEIRKPIKIENINLDK